MVKRCAWGTCNADERYPDRIINVHFLPFPKPKTQREKYLRWIKACGRPHGQLNVDNINKHKFVWSKHFVNGYPTKEFPDPIRADGSTTKPIRPPPKRRCLGSGVQTIGPSVSVLTDEDNRVYDNQPSSQSSSTQTEQTWISPLDFLNLTTAIVNFRAQAERQKMTIKALQKSVTLKDEEIQKLKEEVSKGQKFDVETVKRKAGKLKNLFRYYTGITYIRFLALLQFLVPGDGSFSMTYEKGRCDIRNLSTENCLFLTLCRLRHNFCLKDIAVRFHLTLQSSGAVFNAWVEHMYLKLGQLSLWPHRDTIISNMPRGFKRDFPNSVIIIDGTELRTQIPCALGLQSQLYSDYKSSTTLKCLVGCDPNGSLTFVSELFTGSISDKALTEQSGFYDVLKVLLDHGYIKEGDAVMADKGFTIEDELSELGLELNIPPFVSSETQMTSAETLATEKIAAHRIHIEHLIAKIKKFKIVSHRIPTSLFGRINQIWTVCACMTLFQNVFVTDKHK